MSNNPRLCNTWQFYKWLSHPLSYLNNSANYCYPHFIDKKVEAQRETHWARNPEKLQVSHNKMKFGNNDIEVNTVISLCNNEIAWW